MRLCRHDANFQGSGIKGKMQFGSAWWFLDNLEGRKEQMNALSNMGLISCFVAMPTHSRRSYSYSRHLMGEDLERGLLPMDLPCISKIVQDICHYNAKNYFPSYP